MKKREGSITLLVYTQSRGWSFPVSSTSYKPCGSEPFILCEHFHVRHMPDLGGPLLIVVLPFGASLLGAFARNQQYVFLPLPASFSECVHVRRFQPRCSHTVLYIHYEKASRHWDNGLKPPARIYIGQTAFIKRFHIVSIANFDHSKFRQGGGGNTDSLCESHYIINVCFRIRKSSIHKHFI